MVRPFISGTAGSACSLPHPFLYSAALSRTPARAASRHRPAPAILRNPMSDLQVKVEELSPVLRRIQVDVAAARVQRVTEDIYRRLGQRVKLKGFRQGHVPRRVLEKYFADEVRGDVAREVVQST